MLGGGTRSEGSGDADFEANAAVDQLDSEAEAVSNQGNPREETRE